MSADQPVTWGEQRTIAVIAHVCHEANRALQTEQADPTIPVGPSWYDLDEETLESAIDGVRHIITTGATPEQSHENWCRFKRKHGWIYGPRKDEQAKTHPSLIPYGDLPYAQRVKDTLFHAIVRALS